MIDLRRLIVEFLNTLHDNVYAEDEVPNDATYPYITYSVSGLRITDEYQEIYEVQIHGWDMPEDGRSRNLEELMDLINGDSQLEQPSGLDKAILFNDKIMAAFNVENKISVKDENKTIKHRAYTYACKATKRSD